MMWDVDEAESQLSRMSDRPPRLGAQFPRCLPARWPACTRVADHITRRADAPRRPTVRSAAAPLAARVMAKGPHSSPGGYSKYSNTPKKGGPPSDHSGYSSEDDFEGPTLFGSILRTIMAGGAVVAIAILVRPRDATHARHPRDGNALARVTTRRVKQVRGQRTLSSASRAP